MSLVNVKAAVNGSPVDVQIDPRVHLGDFLREHLKLTGTHLGCEHGSCGSCTVLVNGRAVRSCLMFAVQANGMEIQTVESLGDEDDLHPLQAAFRRRHALQCGFCTPGMLMTLVAHLRDHPNSSEEEMRVAIAGNLCRCTGYDAIVRAAMDTAERRVSSTASVGKAKL